MIGLYLYASGAQRQTMTVLSTLGILESYTNIVTRKRRNKKTSAEPQKGPIDKESTPMPTSIDLEASTTKMESDARASSPSLYYGTLHQLSESMHAQARVIAATGLYSTVYDNINMMFCSAEQIIGRHGTSSISSTF